ncbi:hypothetical protein SCHPADRAFT_939615 [Schizopora paradoxa]|uniref:Uncharacterized protein n=1 Tax=Schizopora paradoxa TaxID=27342 RepID=A0A0H2RRT4_9AGAM|nr:hypothetical protein SCHPADRAFT_939615 [Schizopora paradoxa]
MPSSFFDDIGEDDTSTAYTYYSTWSTNYTTSNLPGSGRIVGNFYSWAGSALEHGIAKLVSRSAKRVHEEAVAALQKGGFRAMFESDDVRSTFRNIFIRRGEFGEVVSFSWRRPSIEYSIEWSYWFKLASRCLSTRPNASVEAAIPVNIDQVSSPTSCFSEFEGILLNCADTVDSLFANEFMHYYWNGKGIESFIRKKGFDDPALLNFAKGLIANWEIYFTITKQLALYFFADSVCSNSGGFFDGLWESLEHFEQSDVLEDDNSLAIWSSVFNIHYFLRSVKIEKVLQREYPTFASTWEETCCHYLPGVRHEKIRKRLSSLRDLYGPTVRERYPPRKWTVAATEGH